MIPLKLRRRYHTEVRHKVILTLDVGRSSDDGYIRLFILLGKWIAEPKNSKREGFRSGENIALGAITERWKGVVPHASPRVVLLPL